MTTRGTGGKGGFRDLELLGGRLGGRETMLELVTRPRERLRERAIRVASHPAEELRRGRERTEHRAHARGRA
jgi:hypothetical protein